jgi:hypothetical protein
VGLELSEHTLKPLDVEFLEGSDFWGNALIAYRTIYLGKLLKYPKDLFSLSYNS